MPARRIEQKGGRLDGVRNATAPTGGLEKWEVALFSFIDLNRSVQGSFSIQIDGFKPVFPKLKVQR